MTTRYDPAPTSVLEQAEALLRQCRHDLADAGVTLGVYMACGWISDDGEDIDKPALVKNRRPVLALPKVVSHKGRTAGMNDVVVYLDGDRWNDLTDRRQEAELYDALQAFELVTDAKGRVKEDPGGRPKLRLRVADVYVEGFAATVARYGDDAPAARQLADAAAACGAVAGGAVGGSVGG